MKPARKSKEMTWGIGVLGPAWGRATSLGCYCRDFSPAPLSTTIVIVVVVFAPPAFGREATVWSPPRGTPARRLDKNARGENE